MSRPEADARELSRMARGYGWDSKDSDMRLIQSENNGVIHA
jgi:hypothetical protein